MPHQQKSLDDLRRSSREHEKLLRALTEKMDKRDQDQQQVKKELSELQKIAERRNDQMENMHIRLDDFREAILRIETMVFQEFQKTRELLHEGVRHDRTIEQEREALRADMKRQEQEFIKWQREEKANQAKDRARFRREIIYKVLAGGTGIVAVLELFRAALSGGF